MRLASCASFVFGCSILFSPSPVFAQFNSSIEGIVTDRSGGVVPSASVTVVNAETNVPRQVTTSGDGFYRVVDLGLGTYNVLVESRGFKTAEQKSVQVAAGQTARVDVVLDVGSLGEKVTVEAQVPQVETDQGRVSGTITTQQLKQLPLNGNNLYNLLAIQPGVSGRGLAATFGAGGGGANNDSSCACVGNLRFGLSFRNLEELMAERNVSVDHITIWRWVQRYAPELHQRCRGIADDEPIVASG